MTIIKTSKDPNRPLIIQKNALLGFFNQSHYQLYHTPVCKVLNSLEAGILFQELVQRYQYHQDREELIEIPNQGYGWFYHTAELIEDRTFLRRRQMDKGMEILKERKIIEVVKWGLPCRNFYRLNFEGIQELLNNLSSLPNVYKLDSSTCTDRGDQRVQTDSLYIEEPKEEPKEERDASPPSPKSQILAKEKIPFGKYVKLHKGEYEKLCTELTKPLVNHYIVAIDLFVPNRKQGEYRDYAAAIRSWHIDDKIKGTLPKFANSGADESDVIFENRDWFRGYMKNLANSNEDEIHPDNTEYVQFRNLERDNSSAKIYFKDPKFKELIKHEAEKREYYPKK